MALAGGLHERGVGRGDVVGLLSYNCPEFLETIFAANYLGAIAMPINWRLAAPEVRYILEHSGARALVCDDAAASSWPTRRRAGLEDAARPGRASRPAAEPGWTTLAELAAAGATARRRRRPGPTTSTGSCTRRARPAARRAS